jgi:hypothetical protein
MSDTSIAQLVGVAGFALAFAAVAMALAVRLVGRRWWSTLVGLMAAATACVPASGIPVAGYLRGILGDLSITSLLVLAAAVFTAASGRNALDERGWTALCRWSMVAGLVLYPLTLGLTRVDPYELGFRPRVLVLVVAAIAIWSWWSRRRSAALVLAAGVAAFNLRVLESGNLWDYVLDPYLFAYATGAVALRSRAGERVRALARDALARARSQTAPVPARAAATTTHQEADGVIAFRPPDTPAERGGQRPTIR